MSRGGFFAVDSLTSVHVLVVDGDASFREVLVALLRYCGALVTAVETTDGALLVMKLLKPDVIVVDFTRPEDGGLVFIRSVRALKPEDGGMVAAVAVGDGGATADLARSRGFDAYVTRPLDPWELCRIVSTLLTR